MVPCGGGGQVRELRTAEHARPGEGGHRDASEPRALRVWVPPGAALAQIPERPQSEQDTFLGLSLCFLLILESPGRSRSSCWAGPIIRTLLGFITKKEELR